MDIRTMFLLWQLLGVVAVESSFSGNFSHFGDQIMLRALSIYTSLKFMERSVFHWLFWVYVYLIKLVQNPDDLLFCMSHIIPLSSFSKQSYFQHFLRNGRSLLPFCFFAYYLIHQGYQRCEQVTLACASHCISCECIFLFCLANYQMWCWSS